MNFNTYWYTLNSHFEGFTVYELRDPSNSRMVLKRSVVSAIEFLGPLYDVTWGDIEASIVQSALYSLVLAGNSLQAAVAVDFDARIRGNH